MIYVWITLDDPRKFNNFDPLVSENRPRGALENGQESDPGCR